MQSVIENILSTINSFKIIEPKNKSLFKNSMTIESLLSNLIEFFKEMEVAIKKERSQPYITDTYENNVRLSATLLVITMASHHSKLENYSEYRELLRQRHIAYGFYNFLDGANNKDLEHCQKILEDPFFNKTLYLGLADFYRNFFGKFSDNEEAIKLLCKYYPHEISLETKIDDITKAISHHIDNAGTVGDSGYAYNGIKLISQYINNLPEEVIHALLLKYELYQIINNKVCRNQIFTIINYSRIVEEDKPKFKFFYLDSLLLANAMNNFLYKNYQTIDTERYYNFHRTDLKEGRIGVIQYTSNEEIYAFWTNTLAAERNFIVGDKPVINISLNIVEDQIIIKNTSKLNNPLDLDFKYQDWLLDIYNSLRFEKKLNELIQAEETLASTGHLTFSLLYLNNYRGVNEQIVDFDHKFKYDKNSKILIPKEADTTIPHFYSNNIYSLSCIVGKNGTGKTTTVDFLRSTFFKFIRLIHDKDIKYINGYVSKPDYMPFKILDEQCEFLIVFHLKGETYYLTNSENVVASQAIPFDPGTYNNVNELSKVIYFSNMLSINQDDLFADTEAIARNNLTQEEEEAEKIANSLNSFRQADYSESTSFIYKRKSMEIVKQKNNNRNNNKDDKDNKNDKDENLNEDNGLVNKELCYQLAFLKHLTTAEISEYYGMPINKTFTLRSELLGKNVPITEYPIRELTIFESFLTAPDAKLEWFSSGQYAKFSFLAKLYWFLAGYEKHIEDFKDMLGPNDFSRDEVLLDGETALIFIDEGELYYHPEWQRNYIKTLIKSIDQTVTQTSSKLQIVITTNSPFIISDILNEDITYLSEKKQDFDRTFGQNIHTLLRENFFMSYTIGEYSREVIQVIMKWLSEKDESKVGEELRRYFGETIEPKEYFRKIHCLINKIGEPIYREKLLHMFSNTKWGIEWEIERDKAFELELLLEQQAEIERKITELQKDR